MHTVEHYGVGDMVEVEVEGEKIVGCVHYVINGDVASPPGIAIATGYDHGILGQMFIYAGDPVKLTYISPPLTFRENVLKLNVMAFTLMRLIDTTTDTGILQAVLADELGRLAQNCVETRP